MRNRFDRYVFDLDETIADSRFLKPAREKAALARGLRPALHAQVADMRACAGAQRLLVDIKANGGTIVILTNSWREYAETVISHLGFSVDQLVAPARKPDPSSLLSIHAGSGRDEKNASLVHIGDSLKDLRASRAAKVPFVMCLWGELDGMPIVPERADEGILLAQVRSMDELRPHLISD